MSPIQNRTSTAMDLRTLVLGQEIVRVVATAAATVVDAAGVPVAGVVDVDAADGPVVAGADVTADMAVAAGGIKPWPRISQIPTDEEFVASGRYWSAALALLAGRTNASAPTCFCLE